MYKRKKDSILIFYRADLLLKSLNDKDYFYLPKEDQLDMRKRLKEIVSEEKCLGLIERGMMLQYMLDELIGYSILGPHLRNKNVNHIQIFKNFSIMVCNKGKPIKCIEKFKNEDHLTIILNRLIHPDKVDLHKVQEYSIRNDLIVKTSLNSDNSTALLAEIYDNR